MGQRVWSVRDCRFDVCLPGFAGPVFGPYRPATNAFTCRVDADIFPTG